MPLEPIRLPAKMFKFNEMTIESAVDKIIVMILDVPMKLSISTDRNFESEIIFVIVNPSPKFEKTVAIPTVAIRNEYNANESRPNERDITNPPISKTPRDVAALRPSQAADPITLPFSLSINRCNFSSINYNPNY